MQDKESGKNFEILLKELGFENRWLLLKVLDSFGRKGVRALDVKQKFDSIGVEKPFATIWRYLEGLEKLGIVVEVDRKYHLTAIGRFLIMQLKDIEKCFNDIGEKYHALCNAIDYFPDDFIKDICILGRARVIEDEYVTTAETFKALELAEKSIFLIAGRSASEDYVRASFRKVVKGLKVRAIVDYSIVRKDVEIYRKTIESLGFGESEVENIKRNHELRAIRNPYLKLMIVDNKFAGISLPPQNKKDAIVPAFSGMDRKFVNYCIKIFRYFWESGEKVEWWEKW